jgi:hypothetical protein
MLEKNINARSLLETRSLPRVWGFAEGQISGTRQRPSLPRAANWGPGQRKALGKDAFAEGQTLGKERPSPKTPSALGKDVLGNFSVLSNDSRALSAFAEGHPSGPRQRF